MWYQGASVGRSRPETHLLWRVGTHAAAGDVGPYAPRVGRVHRGRRGWRLARAKVHLTNCPNPKSSGNSSENIFSDVGGRQRVILLIERLQDRGEAGVTDAYAPTLGIGVTHRDNTAHCEATISETNF